MELKIQGINFAQNFNINKIATRPYFAPMPYDTVSFCKKAKIIAGQKETDIVKEFSKKGVRKEEIVEALKEDWKRKLLEEYLLLSDPKKQIFSKKPTPRQMLFGIQNRFSTEELSRYIQLTNERKSNKSGLILSKEQAEIATANKLDNEQIKRAVKLTEDSTENKTPLSFKDVIIPVKYNLSDDALRKYISLVQLGFHPNVIEQNIFSQKEKLETFERLSSKKSKFSKNIDDSEFFAHCEKGSSDEDIEGYIKYKNQVLECGKTVYEVLKEYGRLNPAYTYYNMSLENLNYFINYMENSKEEREHNKGFDYFNLYDFENKNNLPEKINNLIRPDKNNRYRFSKSLNWAQICIAIRNELTDEQIENLLTITDEKEAKKIGLAHSFSYKVAERLAQKNADVIQYIKNTEKMSVREARATLKTIIPVFYSMFTAAEDDDIYAKLISDLSKKIGVLEKPLDENEQTKTLKGIENIQKSIKGVDLNNCEIKLEENGYVSVSNYPEFERDLNDVLVGLPEFKNTIGRHQQGEHAYTVDKHMLKVLQNTVSDPDFEKLNDSDKRILAITAMFHDLSKKEGKKDNEHPSDSAFDVYYILQRLNLKDFEKIKIYNLIKTHHWLEIVNKAKDKEKAIQDIAFDLRADNEFEMSKILCKADLGAVRANNSFYFDFKELYDNVSSEIEDQVNKIRKTQIFMPQTKFPKASEIKNGKIMEADGIKNTVLIMDDLDDDLSLYGFEEGTTKENFRTFLHGFDSQKYMINFNEFNIIDSDAVLSTCYIDDKDYKVFKQYGFLIDVEHSNIHAGLPYDFGTGSQKDIRGIKNNYIFNNEYSKYTNPRNYIPKLIKTKTNLTDEEYIEKIKNLRGCKSYSDIKKKDPEFAEILNNMFYDMELKKRSYDRQYNEFLCSNPKVKAVYSYDKKYEEIPLFLRKYAQGNDLPIIMFGSH